MALFKYEGYNKHGFISEHSLAGFHCHRKQCKTLHYSISLTNDQILNLILPAVLLLTPLINCPQPLLNSSLNNTKKMEIEKSNRCSDIMASLAPAGLMMIQKAKAYKKLLCLFQFNQS